MFIRRREVDGRMFYEVAESVQQDGKQKTTRIVVSLGHEKSLRAAYEKEINQLKKSQDKIAGLEKAIAVIGIDARYGEPRKKGPSPQNNSKRTRPASTVWAKLNKAVEDFCVAMYASESAEEKAEIAHEFAELLGANGFYEYCRTVKESEGEDGNSTLPK